LILHPRSIIEQLTHPTNTILRTNPYATGYPPEYLPNKIKEGSARITGEIWLARQEGRSKA